MSVVVPPPLGLLLSMAEQRQEAGGWDKVDTTRLRILQASSLSNVSLLIHLQAHNLTRHKYCQTKQPYTDFQAMCRPMPIQCHISTQEDISSNSPFFPYIWLRALVRPIQQGSLCMLEETSALQCIARRSFKGGDFLQKLQRTKTMRSRRNCIHNMQALRAFLRLAHTINYRAVSLSF